MSKTEKNAFHLVDPSPWPLVTATSLLVVTSGGVMYMHGKENGGMMLAGGVAMLLISMSIWFRDIIREGTYEGNHTSMVQIGMRMGMILFIISEVMFFVAFFWSYYWSSMSPAVEIGGIWVPKGIEPINAMEIPLLNTMILLSSGASVTYAHHSMVIGDRRGTLQGMGITIGLAALFTGLQVFEYMHGEFGISDSVYGSTFYMATGFHGLHVIVGTIMLSVATVRIYKYEMTKQHHFGFESAAWYWHFVDVVWLWLYVSIYCWV